MKTWSLECACVFWVFLIIECGWIFTNRSGEIGEASRDQFMKILEGITTEIEMVSDRDNQPYYYFFLKQKSER